jgi:hypothetical protein
MKRVDTMGERTWMSPDECMWAPGCGRAEWRQDQNNIFPDSKML